MKIQFIMKHINFYSHITHIIFFGLLLNLPALTQETQEEADNQPVRSPFETVTLIDNQTIVNPVSGTLQLEILHRFGKIENLKDLYGIYASANTKLGLNYGITDKLMVGIGTERNNKLQDIRWKYSILQQTRSGSMPVALSYYGNMVIDAGSEDKFTGEGREYKFLHRLSYFHQLVLARKFSSKLSLMAAPSVTYFNAVELGVNNLNLAFTIGGRAMVLGTSSIIFEYTQPFTENEITIGTKTLLNKPGLSIGLEIGTSTHAFRVFVSNYNQIINQRNIVYNTNDFFGGDVFFGFNITVRL